MMQGMDAASAGDMFFAQTSSLREEMALAGITKQDAGSTL